MVHQAKTNPGVLSSNTIIGGEVRNLRGEDLGKIEELMINLQDGSIAYAVVSFGGFLGIWDKLFVVPWKALSLRPAEKAFFLDIPKEKLENAPGFDKDEWPNMADKDWVERIDKFYGNPGTRLNG
jgi:hypothetical protein